MYPPQERKQEANLRFVSKQLEQIIELDPAALTTSRPPENRVLGTCRDFSIFLCALLRHQGIPARARCGFANYFTPGKCKDHWVCEYWNADEQRWIMVDAQLDEFQRRIFEVKVDPLDVPADRFLTGPKVWQMCRLEQADPDKFGLFDMHGLWFIRGNVVRDLASLNKIPLLPWDCWGLINGGDDDLSDDDFALLDRVAVLTLDGDPLFSDLCSIYESNENLRVPPTITSYVGGEYLRVDLSQDCASIFARASDP